jgi:hypothetical protein
LSEIYYRGFADPESLTDEEISIFMVYLNLSSGNFERIYRAHNLGLIPEETWEYLRAGIGYAFLSRPGRDTIEIMLKSTFNGPMWEIIDQSTKDALAYCLNPNNRCVQPQASVRS